MRKLLEKLDRVDRRVIYVLMALSVFVPLVFRLDFPIPVGGGPSRDLFEELMADEEGHIDFLETQLDLVSKLGLQLYAQHHIGELDED